MYTFLLRFIFVLIKFYYIVIFLIFSVNVITFYICIIRILTTKAANKKYMYVSMLLLCSIKIIFRKENLDMIIL